MTVKLTAAVPMDRKNKLEQRIKAPFDEGRSHQPLSYRLARVLFAGAVLVLIGLVVVSPGPSLDPMPPPTNTPAGTTASDTVLLTDAPPVEALPVAANDAVRTVVLHGKVLG